MVEGGLMCWLYPLLDVAVNLSKGNDQLANDERPTMEEGRAVRFPGLINPNEDAHQRYIQPYLEEARQKREEIRLREN